MFDRFLRAVVVVKDPLKRDKANKRVSEVAWQRGAGESEGTRRGTAAVRHVGTQLYR